MSTSLIRTKSLIGTYVFCCYSPVQLARVYCKGNDVFVFERANSKCLYFENFMGRHSGKFRRLLSIYHKISANSVMISGAQSMP